MKHKPVTGSLLALITLISLTTITCGGSGTAAIPTPLAASKFGITDPAQAALILADESVDFQIKKAVLKNDTNNTQQELNIAEGITPGDYTPFTRVSIPPDRRWRGVVGITPGGYTLLITYWAQGTGNSPLAGSDTATFTCEDLDTQHLTIQAGEAYTYTLTGGEPCTQFLYEPPKGYLYK